MNYTTYLFDFDYTLADSSRGIVICYRNVLTSHGYTEVTDEAIKRTIGKTLEESFSILTGVTDEELLVGFRREYVQEANVHMTVNTRFFPETRTVLKELKERGARIGIISTKYRFRIHELLDQHFADNFMDIIVGGEDVQAAKPSPEGLLHAINRLNADKRQVLYIGDSTVDAETARAAGVDFAGITHGVTTAEELARYPHVCIMTSLEELLNEQD
nr:HAD-IA family hydrolase [uncultured Bacteroides sp.]